MSKFLDNHNFDIDDDDGDDDLRNKYLTEQIITYMGNKRKILPYIENALLDIRDDLKVDWLSCGDGFSGSGIVSRLMKLYSDELWVNDLAGYSKTLNECFLANLSEKEMDELSGYIEQANSFAGMKSKKTKHKSKSNVDFDSGYIQKYWSPKSKRVVKDRERAYFTNENGRRIDRYRQFIREMPKKYRSFLLASLLVESSIHNNTGGHFASFYKKDGVGHFGGKNENDLGRIMDPITLEMPVLYNVGLDGDDGGQEFEYDIRQMDTNEWVKKIPELDVVYFDPPYNKHPYNIYYFLLDIINDVDTEYDIPDTLRGQPKTWKQSEYNSFTKAVDAFEDLIMNCNAKYILVSYNNNGIIPLDKMERILKKKGKVSLVELEHKTYNKLKGMAKYKTKEKKKKITECLYKCKCY
jgi:adenine-specific DNA-methyltransferase